MTLLLGAGGAIPRSQRDTMDIHAEMYYQAIRNRTSNSDVANISKHSGFSFEDVLKIKTHVFMNYHDLGYDEPSRFDADYDQAQSWQRLETGVGIREMDRVFLHHELMELTLISEQGLSYFEAHNETNKVYNYQQYVTDLDRKEGMQ